MSGSIGGTTVCPKWGVVGMSVTEGGVCVATGVLLEPVGGVRVGTSPDTWPGTSVVDVMLPGSVGLQPSISNIRVAALWNDVG